MRLHRSGTTHDECARQRRAERGARPASIAAPSCRPPRWRRCSRCSTAAPASPRRRGFSGSYGGPFTVTLAELRRALVGRRRRARGRRIGRADGALPQRVLDLRGAVDGVPACGVLSDRDHLDRLSTARRTAPRSRSPAPVPAGPLRAGSPPSPRLTTPSRARSRSAGRVERRRCAALAKARSGVKLICRCAAPAERLLLAPRT